MLALHPTAAPSPLPFAPSGPERRARHRAATDRSAAQLAWVRSVTAGMPKRPGWPSAPAHTAAVRTLPIGLQRSASTGTAVLTPSPATATAIGLPWPLPGVDRHGERRRPDAPAHPAGDRPDNRRPRLQADAWTLPAPSAAPSAPATPPAAAARVSAATFRPLGHHGNVSAHSLAGFAFVSREAGWIDPLEVMAASDAADLALLKSVMLMTAATLLLALTARMLA
jgi:hypothetical protein